MAVSLYDNALLEKIKAWSKDTKMTIYGVSDSKRLFETLADDSNDKPIKLPIISIRRSGAYKILNTNHKPTTFDGFTLEANYDKSTQLNVIPIEPSYTLDVYTRYMEEADEYIRNLIFNIINFPVLDIKVPYSNYNNIKRAYIKLREDVEDNSDIPERLISGQFTRLSLGLYIEDAYLWDVRTRDNVHICAEMNED